MTRAEWRLMLPVLGLLTIGGPGRADTAQPPAPPHLVCILGQSQSATETHCPFLEAQGLASVSGGDFWTASGRRLFDFQPDASGGAGLKQTVELPGAITAPICSDGDATLFAAGSDGWLYALDTRAAVPKPVALVRLPDGVRSITAAPADAKRGWPARASVFALTSGGTVTAYVKGAWQSVLTLPKPSPASPDFAWQCIGIEPVSGDLLAGSGYPDMKVYRFGVDARQVVRDGWPRPGFASAISTVRGMAWTLTEGDQAVSLPPVAQGPSPHFDIPWLHDASGMAAAPQGGFWIAAPQGIARFDRWGIPTGTRIGGLPSVDRLALDADGTVIASVQNGTRLVRLRLEDLPDTPLTCNANSSWQIGGGSGGVCGGLVASGQAFLVADAAHKRLGVFDPDKTIGGDKPWTAITSTPALQSPESVAGGDYRLWVLDGGRVWEGAVGDAIDLHPVDLPGIAGLGPLTCLAATPDENTLCVSDGASVLVFQRQPDGGYQKRRQVGGLTGVTSLAASPTSVYALCRPAGTITMLDIASGAVSPVTLGAGIHASALAMQGPWLVVADDTHARLLVYKLSQD